MRSRCSWAVLAILATVGGCGGGDAEQPPAPDRPLTKHELIRRGDALCREFHAKTPDTADIQDFDDLQRQVEQVIALTEETLAKFERLKPPPGDENPIDSY